MAETACPYCGAKLFPHELRNGECSSCMRKLPANVTAEAPVEPEYRGGPQPQPQWQGGGRDPYGDPIIRGGGAGPYDAGDRPAGPEYGTFRTGVNLFRWGLGIVFAVQVIQILMGLAILAMVQGGGVGGGRDLFEMMQLLNMLLSIAALVAALLTFIGVCMCCAVPGSSQASGWGRGLLVCLLSTVGLVILDILVFFSFMMHAVGGGFGRGGEEAGMFMLLLVGLTVLAYFGTILCLFMTFRGVSHDFRDYSLGGGFLAYFITSIVISVVAVIGWFLFFAAMINGGMRGGFAGPRDMEAVVMVFGCVALIVWLCMFVWLMTLLSRLYNLIPSGYGGGRYGYGARY